jgi:hypothetical protein
VSLIIKWNVSKEFFLDFLKLNIYSHPWPNNQPPSNFNYLQCPVFMRSHFEFLLRIGLGLFERQHAIYGPYILSPQSYLWRSLYFEFQLGEKRKGNIFVKKSSRKKKIEWTNENKSLTGLIFFKMYFVILYLCFFDLSRKIVQSRSFRCLKAGVSNTWPARCICAAREHLKNWHCFIFIKFSLFSELI